MIVAFATIVSVLALTSCEEQTAFVEEFTVTYIATTGGAIQGNSEQVVRYGESASVVTAVPNTGFEFVRWSDGSTIPARLDQNITARLIMIAEFGRQKETPPEPYTYHDVIYVAGTGGTIQGKSQQLIRENQEATEVKAVANFGFRFVRWSDGIETTIRHDKNITERLVVVAEFEKIQEPPPPPYVYHAVTYFVLANGTIEGNAEQTIRQGYNATIVTAVPDTGFVFARWSDGYLNATRHDMNIQARLTVMAVFEEALFYGGKGTLINPFLVANRRHLANMRYFSNAYFALTNDIDLYEVNHEPIFDSENSFLGNFEGNHFTITNMSIESNHQYPSLFGHVKGNIKNLNISKFEIIVSDENGCFVGAVASFSSGLIKNVNVCGKIYGHDVTRSITVGGLVGRKEDKPVINSHTNILIKFRSNENIHNSLTVGGFVGSSIVSIVDSSSSGEISISQGAIGSLTMGGFIGAVIISDGREINIEDSFSDIKIISDIEIIFGTTRVGGFLGVAQSRGLIIKNCHSKGDLYGGRVSGFIGVLNSSVDISYSSVRGNVTATGYAFGFTYRVSGSTISYSFVSGNVVGRRSVGFIYLVGFSTIFRSFVSGSVVSGMGLSQTNDPTNVVVGFIFSLTESIVEESFTTGNIISKRVHASRSQTASFIWSANRSTILNSFSSSDLVIYARPQQFGGLATIAINNTYIVNSFFAGNIIKRSSFEDISPPSMAKFVRSFGNNSQIKNSHVLFQENAPSAISVYGGGMIHIDLTIHDSLSQMFNLADILNTDASNPIWLNVEGSFPRLKYTKNMVL